MKKSKLTEKQRKILNIVISAVQIAVVLITVTISIIVAVNPNIYNGEVSDSKIKLLPVLTNSMDGNEKDSFKAGDLIIAKTPKDAAKLEVGDIITFQYVIGDQHVLNTHRIVNKGEDFNGVYYEVKGDNPLATKIDLVREDEILAVYSGKIKGLGKAISWLQEPTNFLLVIVIPLIVLFVYNIVILIRMIMQAKVQQAKEEQDSLNIDAEEIKRKAIEEYLKQQAENASLANETASPAVENAEDAPKE